MSLRVSLLAIFCLWPALALAARSEPAAIPLWPAGAPGSEGKTAPETVVETDGIRRVATIHNPSLASYLPPKKKATGAAVIILPGGGHRYLSIDNEGHAVARWLTAHGVAGFVLKYRLAREEGSTYKVAEHALQDVQRALRLVRSRAKEWGVDPARVGILGFSAGGELATFAGSRFDTGKPDAADPLERESARPAFQGLLYPGAPADLVIPKDAPPAFLCTAADDKNPTRNALGLFQKLREAGVEAELHVYARGGHGFGMKDRPVPITSWALRFHEWLGDQGFLKPAPPPKAADRLDLQLDQQFAQTVRPFLSAHCLGCHGDKPKGDLDLRPYTSLAAVVADFPRWAQVLDKVKSGEMPPKKFETQPAPTTRQAVSGWIEAVRAHEARKHAGDPGPVLARRLSNAEYNYSIRDLTGVDIRPTREFPVDPSNPEGFDNTGESLAMSPALLKKYLQAAREVASHLVLETEGIAFAPHPMLVETDRDKYCVSRIVDFYRRQNTDLAAYFRSAWRWKHRAALGQRGGAHATLAQQAAADQVSPKYLETMWQALEGPREVGGPLAVVQAMWRKLPGPRPGEKQPAEAGFTALRDHVLQLRQQLQPRFGSPAADIDTEDLPATAQPFVMWRNRQSANHRMSCDPKGEIPPAERAGHEAAFGRFCATFPDAFYVAERGRNPNDKTTDKGRLLSAGFHNVMGYFRDDQPLYQLMLDEKQQVELDRLWDQLDFVAAATRRTYAQFTSNGAAGAAFRGLLPGTDVTAALAMKKAEAAYLAKLPAGAPATATTAIKEHFGAVNARLRWVEAARPPAEAKHLAALLDFAQRAYRRPLSSAEREDLAGYYKSLRGPGHLDHDEAMRDVLVSVLMSPDFCYRVDLVAPGPGIRPLSDHALASRLSYFLWSSLPDAELLAHARAGDLHRPEVMTAQARRMLKDPRARGLASEFAGNWLGFRNFQQHNAVDRQRFPSFDEPLREAMFEEPVRFMLDAFAQDGRSVLDFLYGKHTFVNATLAKHYGLPAAALGPPDAQGWSRVADASKYGRGGLLPMAAFLTKNAPGLRTSPVKRGYWVVKNVLGERIPPPPAVVPELPRDEAQLELPLRETLARHREDPACAGCHARFDALGLVFENYGPIGERRSVDLAGRPVDVRATFPGGDAGSGLAGLRQYLRQHRQGDFLDNFARKLLAYGLGRSLMPSDDATIAQMKRQLAAANFRVGSLIESVVGSPQFLNKRGRETLAVGQVGQTP